ncbi:uncharacterized protein BX663DRAFT_549411 [Cokeromyces recurvatus]|uniref:uncharacterized protein n=1 Tax=Cokeromyces recurvatus TaxID=90255 RepID=UPI00222058B2|nr:uncharacterized protein BX663DRAFT_549411 [Cokeromyces recurvatus]KAI7905406.1 hypothetical protein BX663DRAFT_549411 [Cokeromyces recurvatus]
METERKLKNIAMDYYDSKINTREASKCITNLTSDKGDSAEDNVLLEIRNLAIVNVSWCEPVVVGEVKGEDRSNDVFDTLLDLIRIGHLSKQAIDNNLYDAVLGMHVIGLQATIYVTCLLDYGLYTMLEIYSMTMPRDMSNIRGYISSCEDLLPLCDLYKNYCRKSNEPETLRQKITQGISDAVFKNITNTSKNRKRPCPFIVNP